MGHKLIFLDENQTKCSSHEKMNTKIVANWLQWDCIYDQHKKQLQKCPNVVANN
jgi:hypothetical protein